jgi:acetyl esterase/lipase
LDIEAVDPTLRSTTGRMPALPLEKPLVRGVIGLGTRLGPGKRISGVARRVVRDGPVRVRVYMPQDADGSALLWIHGGGLVIGAAKMDDRLCGETARRLGTTIVSVDYRLAPKHPFPAAIDDCHAAWRWLLAHAVELGIDTGRVAIGGQSAGGGLAACLVQRLHDEGGEGGDVAAQWLFCPMLDDRTAADRTHDATDHFVWNNRSNLVGWSSYLGAAPGAASAAPYAVAARRDDLAGLPPTWIYTSDIELFHDEDIEYAGRLDTAGVDVTLEVVHGAPHGFETWATDGPLAQELLSKARAWLGAQLRREA